MSAKNMDKHNRWRNKTVAFRVSPEEDAQIEMAVKLTGLTKQDYIIRRLLCRDVVVQGNPRVYTLEVVGRDQPDQRLYLSKDQENLVWGLDHTENELWKQPPDPVLEAVAKIVSADNREWAGSPTELAQAIQTDMAVNRLTKHLNVNASRLLEEHQVKYENKTRHAGRRIRLTYMVVEAPAFEVIEVIE